MTTLSAALVTATFALFLFLIAPRRWVKWMTTPIFPLIPLLNTRRAIAEDRKSKARSKGNGAQWLYFWVAWVVFGWMGEMVRIFKPGYVNVWEIARVAMAVGLGGPWLGRKAFL